MKFLLLLSLFSLVACVHGTTNKGTLRKPSAEESTIAPVLIEDSDKEVYSADFVGVYNNVERSPLVDFVISAQRTVDVEIYEMYDKDFVLALDHALKRGIRVRVVKDPFPVGGDKCSLFGNPKKERWPAQEDSETENPEANTQNDNVCDLLKSIKERASSSGGAFVAFNRPTLCGRVEQAKAQCVQHGKMVIVDGEKALISSGNFNATSLCNLKENPTKCNRDYSYITRDPDVLKGLQGVFESDLKKERYDLEKLVRDPAIEGKITVSPYSLEPLISFVKSAQKTLQIQNQYMKDPEWNNAIKEAAQRGVHVDLQISNLLEYGKPKPSAIKRLCTLLGDFKKAGVAIRVFTKKMLQKDRYGYLHAKAMVADSENPTAAKAWVGSTNGSTAALALNREFGIFFNNPQRVRLLSDVMKADFSHRESLSWEQQIDCTSIK